MNKINKVMNTPEGGVGGGGGGGYPPNMKSIRVTLATV